MHARSFLLLVAVLLVSACGSDAPEPLDAAAGYDAYGERITPEGAVPVQAVVAEPNLYVGQPTKLEGTVQEVCQQAGCWLTFDAGEGQQVRVRVPHGDDGYAFTFPKDISGRRVVARGVLEAKTLTEAEQRHLAEDAGQPVDDATLAAQPELFMTVTGALVEPAS